MKCPACGTEVFQKGRYCPKCGYDFSGAESAVKKEAGGKVLKVKVEKTFEKEVRGLQKGEHIDIEYSVKNCPLKFNAFLELLAKCLQSHGVATREHTGMDAFATGQAKVASISSSGENRSQMHVSSSPTIFGSAEGSLTVLETGSFSARVKNLEIEQKNLSVKGGIVFGMNWCLFTIFIWLLVFFVSYSVSALYPKTGAKADSFYKSLLVLKPDLSRTFFDRNYDLFSASAISAVFIFPLLLFTIPMRIAVRNSREKCAKSIGEAFADLEKELAKELDELVG